MARRTDEPRDKKVWVYLTQAEHTQLTELAAALDMTVSALVRASALGTLHLGRVTDLGGYRVVDEIKLTRDGAL